VRGAALHPETPFPRGSLAKPNHRRWNEFLKRAGSFETGSKSRNIKQKQTKSKAMRQLVFQNGDRMPALGLGTWKSKPGEVYQAVRDALRIGYRHFDCAAIYENEPEIGQAFRDAFVAGEVRREDIWVTSKLWNTAHRRQHVRPALEKTMADLQLDYLDLYLVHWPVAMVETASFPFRAHHLLPLSEVPLEETWQGMEELKTAGLVRHVGVSNFSISKIEALLASCSQQPEMNQVEMQPYLQQTALAAHCQRQKVLMTAYSPFGSRDRSVLFKDPGEPDLFADAVLASIAADKGCTVPQVLLAWALTRGTSVIPKSVNSARMLENLQAADMTLSEAEMEEIAKLERGYRFIDGSFWTPAGSPYTLESLWG
jgi:alcohol dehydrogenase (NADP+)